MRNSVSLFKKFPQGYNWIMSFAVLCYQFEHMNDKSTVKSMKSSISWTGYY
jgi:hypothetical protein